MTCICLIAGCLSGEKSRDSVTQRVHERSWHHRSAAWYMSRAMITDVWTRNAEGGRGGGNAKLYIGQSADDSVVLGPWFITCVSIVSRYRFV